MSIKHISVCNPEQLPLVTDFVHDCWFETNDIKFDSSQSILSFKFFKELIEENNVVKDYWVIKQVEVPTFECLLQIKRVKSYVINDTEQVGIYDFGEVIYDNSGRLIITTGVPLEIEIFIEKLEVEIEISTNVVSTKRKMLFS